LDHSAGGHGSELVAVLYCDVDSRRGATLAMHAEAYLDRTLPFPTAFTAQCQAVTIGSDVPLLSLRDG
jgi:hypothetical protein